MSDSVPTIDIGAALDLLIKCHEFVCNVDVRGGWWNDRRSELADELSRELITEYDRRCAEMARKDGAA